MNVADRYFRRGRHRANWYDRTREIVGRLFAPDRDRVLSMLAATSVNASVKANASHTLRAYEAYRRGVDPEAAGFLPHVVDNLRRIFGGDLDAVEGPKVAPFARALRGDRSAVPVDRWMYRAYPDRDGRSAVAEAIRRDARRWGVAPCEAQAAVWTGIRPGDGRNLGEILREALGTRQLSFTL